MRLLQSITPSEVFLLQWKEQMSPTHRERVMENGGIHLLNLKKMCKDSFLSVNHLRGVLLQSAARTFQIPSNPL